jgi:hypothetical protein
MLIYKNAPKMKCYRFYSPQLKSSVLLQAKVCVSTRGRLLCYSVKMLLVRTNGKGKITHVPKHYALKSHRGSRDKVTGSNRRVDRQINNKKRSDFVFNFSLC